jgi:hypothetical protein
MAICGRSLDAHLDQTVNRLSGENSDPEIRQPGVRLWTAIEVYCCRYSVTSAHSMYSGIIFIRYEVYYWALLWSATVHYFVASISWLVPYEWQATYCACSAV